MKIYVGNLSYDTSEAQLREMFEAHGAVKSASLAMDRESGRPRGFGFVEMGDDEARNAIKALDGTQSGGRSLTVNEAKPKTGGGGFGGGGGGGRGRY